MGQDLLAQDAVTVQEQTPRDAGWILDRRYGPVPKRLGRQHGLAYRLHAAQRAAPPLSGAQIRTLYEKSDPERWTLQDLGHLSHVHPLELWLLGYLYQHPAATLSDAIDASSQQRQDAYRWLFRTTNARAQQRAIQTLVEAEAFADIHAAWQRQGYPFQSLVPSYATAIGSSGDKINLATSMLALAISLASQAQ